MISSDFSLVCTVFSNTIHITWKIVQLRILLFYIEINDEVCIFCNDSSFATKAKFYHIYNTYFRHICLLITYFMQFINLCRCRWVQTGI